MKQNKKRRSLFRTHPQPVHDIFHNARKSVISLRPHTVKFELSLAALHRAYQRRRLAVLGCCLIVILGVAFGTYRAITWADSAVLYPSTCLGGWNNPQNAEGRPDIDSTGDATAFTADNSAVLPANASSDIFCGGFTGSMPADAQPTKLTLTFSWATEQPAPPAATAVPEMSDASTTSDTSAASTTQNDTTPPIETDTTSATDTTATTNATDTTDVPAPTDTTSPAPADSDTPLSLLYLLTPKAHAQDATETDATSSESQDAGDGFLDISYTLDGNTWQDLGTVDATQMASASFDIPIVAGARWQEMANLQVRINSIPSLDPTPTVYLDGMQLAASYLDAPVEEVQSDATTSASSSTQLVDQSVFTAAEQSSVYIHPKYTDGSTNIIFYTDNAPQYFAETIATGAHALTDYFNPPLTNGKYIVVEYFNDGGSFGCSGLSLAQCVADPHFVEQLHFEIADASSTTVATSSDATLSP